MIVPLRAPAPTTDATDAIESAVEPDVDDAEALDAYSVAVSTAAERLIPSVASLRVTRQMGNWSEIGRAHV